jgi:hypothetical protein
VKSVHISVPTRSLNGNLHRRLTSSSGIAALGAVVLAASAGSALAQPRTDSLTASATVKNTGTSVDRKTVEPRTQGTPAPINADDKPVVRPDARKPAPKAGSAPAATSGDEAYLESVRSSFGWIDLPADFAGPKDDKAYLESVSSSFGWIDLPADMTGFKNDQEFADTVNAAFGWIDVSNVAR